MGKGQAQGGRTGTRHRRRAADPLRRPRRPPGPRLRASRKTTTKPFADGFGFEETNDQAQAIAAVIEDMRSGKPMDRLVCGDVGFGKTEVALRAAFCAVAGGKQVAVLCPTTLLCEQHYQTFVDRFADWPVKIAEISRFKTAKESAQALAGAGRRQDRRDHRHPQADRQGRQVQPPRAGGHRRGAPFWCAPEGNAEGHARRGRRADADRNADPAHAGDERWKACATSR